MDPRRTITQDNFSVAPQLLGLPLARPSRRALAMLVDLILIVILTNAGAPVFGFAAAFVLWRIGSKGLFRWFFRVGAVGVVIVTLALWGVLRDNDEEPARVSDRDGTEEFQFDMGDLEIGPTDGVRLIRWGGLLRTTRDSARAASLADSIAALLRRSGASADDLNDFRQQMHQAIESDRSSAVRVAIDRAFGVPSGERNETAVLAGQFNAAVERNDSIAADSLRRQLRQALAGSQLDQLQREVERRQHRIGELQADLEAARAGRGVKTRLLSFFDDLGLGFGWAALYFTAFLVLLRGQTPGKKVAGVRVVRLDAKPITWFIAFERFGGYAASLTLGLLGFLQILWDRNRQGLHDKAVETVVIRELPTSTPALPH